MNKVVKDFFISVKNMICAMSMWLFMSLFFTPVIYLWVKIVKLAWGA
jgi:hypothetical protein